jgi:hypothetical protein
MTHSLVVMDTFGGESQDCGLMTAAMAILLTGGFCDAGLANCGAVGFIARWGDCALPEYDGVETFEGGEVAETGVETTEFVRETFVMVRKSLEEDGVEVVLADDAAIVGGLMRLG